MSSATLNARIIDSLSLLSWPRMTHLQFLNSLHPLCYFTLKVFISIFAIGFVPSQSNLRIILMLVVILCACGIVNNGGEYLRPLWISPLSGFSNGIVLQYLDLALIRHWEFDTKSKSFISQKQVTIQNQIPIFLQRFYFGSLNIFSFRKVNTPYEVKNTPQFRHGEAPSKARFLRQHAIKVLFCVLILDISCQIPPPSDPARVFSPDRIRFLSRYDEVSGDEIIVRVVGSLLYWCNIFAVLQGFFSVVAILAVGFGLSDVRNWKPLFGSPHDATSLRGFWGKFWHQSLRDALYRPASFLSHTVLRLPSGILSRYTKLILAFFISGLMHAFAEASTGLAMHHGGSVRFFCTQSFGIIVEDIVHALFSHRNFFPSSRFHLLRDLLGYLWVGCFMTWSTPGWLYPDAIRGVKAPFLPFSIVKLVGSRFFRS